MIFNMTLSEQGSLAELTNIRIGADGTNYPTAGDAVRGQVTALKEDLGAIANSKIKYSGILTDTGTATGVWKTPTIPTDIDEPYVCVPEVSGLNNPTHLIQVHVVYADSTSTDTYVDDLNTWIKVNVNKNKTVSAYYLYCYRSDSAVGSSTTSTWRVIITDGSLLKMIDAFKESEDKKQSFVDTVTGAKYRYFDTLTDTGTAAGVWKTPPIPTDMKEPYICVPEVSGLDNPTHLLTVNVTYTDSTQMAFNIDALNTWTKLNINTNKTVLAYTLYCYRANSAVGSATNSSWTVAFSDGLSIWNEIAKSEGSVSAISDRVDTTFKSLINTIYSNHSDGEYYGTKNVEYVAQTDHEEWQAKSFTKEIEFAVNPNELFSIGCIGMDAIGNQLATIVVERSGGSGDATYPINKGNTRQDINGGFIYTMSAPSYSTKARVIFYAISNTGTSGESSVVGHKYYVNGAFAFKGTLEMNGDSVIPQSWKDKIQTIKSAQEDCFVIGIQTDTHYFNGMSNVLGSNLSELTKFIGMDCIANLGDIIQGYNNPVLDAFDKAKASMTEIVKRYCDKSKCPVMLLLGNHDSNYSYDEEHEFSFKELYARLFKPSINTNPNIQIENGNLYYYTDFPSLRLIVLNTNDGITPHSFGISNAQLSWFTNKALDTTKQVLVLSHVPLLSGISENYDASYADVITALETYKSGGGTVVGCFYGHIHDARPVDYSTGGILQMGFVWSGNFANQDNAEIVLIDTANEEISSYGLGNASNRGPIPYEPVD